MLAVIMFSNCQGHNNPSVTMKISDTLQNRQPAVAGSFYPSERMELTKELQQCFSETPVCIADREVQAIISPHAGYVFSGKVAAAAFSQLDPAKQYKTIFVIGSSHRNSFPGASVYSTGNYITPLGVVPTDLETAHKLAAENKVMDFNPQYHSGEHSIEVQLPFLQYYLTTNFKIVPVLLGTQDAATCKKIADALKPYFLPENLFVISTDFSHYPAYNDAVKSDKQLADAIVTNQPDEFLKAVENCTRLNVGNLVTGCCSWPSVITLMYLTEKKPGITFHEISYSNSGDSKYGEKNRVVGYWALSASTQKSDISLFTPAEQKELLTLARHTIGTYLRENRIPEVDEKSLPQGLQNNAGAFVTLKKSGELRGCIGHFEAENPLYKIIQKMAVASATQDYRFPTVKAEELNLLDIEISVLTPMLKIKDVKQIRLGVDGIYIKKGNRSGTFLPQVATDTGWSLEEFLGHCARDKAGIGWEGWKDKDVEIFTYQAYVFGENE